MNRFFSRGTLGLFLGISILSFAEFIELALILIIAARKHYSNKRKVMQIEN